MSEGAPVIEAEVKPKPVESKSSPWFKRIARTGAAGLIAFTTGFMSHPDQVNADTPTPEPTPTTTPTKTPVPTSTPDMTVTAIAHKQETVTALEKKRDQDQKSADLDKKAKEIAEEIDAIQKGVPTNTAIPTRTPIPPATPTFTAEQKAIMEDAERRRRAQVPTSTPTAKAEPKTPPSTAPRSSPNPPPPEGGNGIPVGEIAAGIATVAAAGTAAAVAIRRRRGAEHTEADEETPLDDDEI